MYLLQRTTLKILKWGDVGIEPKWQLITEATSLAMATLTQISHLLNSNEILCRHLCPPDFLSLPQAWG